jgi:hypothetical protein
LSSKGQHHSIVATRRAFIVNHVLSTSSFTLSIEGIGKLISTANLKNSKSYLFHIVQYDCISAQTGESKGIVRPFCHSQCSSPALQAPIADSKNEILTRIPRSPRKTGNSWDGASNGEGQSGTDPLRTNLYHLPQSLMRWSH